MITYDNKGFGAIFDENNYNDISDKNDSGNNINDNDDISSDSDSATENNGNDDSESIISKFQWFCHDIENLLKENDPTLNNSVRKFVKIYKLHRSKKDSYVRPAIASFLQSCNWDAGQVHGSKYHVEGKRIRVQIAASSRRKCPNCSLKRMHQRRPRKSRKKLVDNIEEQRIDQFVIPVRSKRQKKWPHDLQQAILENRPNGVA
ncbi:hypothetical protein C2G38_2191891 [Gigaspora rosea]|uniref:Uncharacterized protein n=1 Tax=Gigaspora rosea TaxID=44941 RepID=A0A397V402_9GLOM|nr:hypothetical protein C2G38_2191891 [Gigaspora rosea]